MKKFLIVVDMQKDFVDGALGTPEAVSIVPRVVEKIQSFPGELFVTLDTHEADYLQTAEGKKLPRFCLFQPLFGVNPKFCVNSISGANRAKFICGGSRLVRLPPW